MSMADIFGDPHYRARQMIIDVPAEGSARCPSPASCRSSRGARTRRTPGAALGRHTDEILAGLLGTDLGRIAKLRAEGVI